MPASEMYIFPVDPIHAVAGPFNAGTGNGFTVAAVVALLVQPLPLVTVRV